MNFQKNIGVNQEFLIVVLKNKQVKSSVFEKEAKNIAKISNVLKDLKSETIMKRFNATIDVGGKEVAKLLV